MSGGVVEGMNLKVKLTMRKAYGFRTLKRLEIFLGSFSEPNYFDRFC